MTPPIRFRTDASQNNGGPVTHARPATLIGDMTGIGASVATSSRIADYTYRIAALTVGLALLVTGM
jgi:hypothetical protein